jgi:hypothetical protein
MAEHLNPPFKFLNERNKFLLSKLAAIKNNYE